MPHIILEHSGNISPDETPLTTLIGLSSALAEFETFKRADIKGRCFRSPDFVVADGDSKNAFVHLRLEILAGRPVPLRKSVAVRFLEILQNSFRKASQNFHVSYSVEIREMDRETYLK